MATTDSGKRPSSKTASRIALVAVLTAVTVVFTIAVRFPTPIVKGYISLCDVVICFAAYLFGPWVAAISGGVGTAVADLLGGYSQWAPFSLVIHGAQGLLVGLFAKPRVERGQLVEASLWRLVLGGILGMAAMVGGYYLAGSLFYGFEAALVEIPLNALQAGVGVVLGIVVSKTTVRAYPPARSMMW